MYQDTDTISTSNDANMVKRYMRDILSQNVYHAPAITYLCIRKLGNRGDTSVTRTAWDNVKEYMRLYDFFLVSPLVQACDRLRVCLVNIYRTPESENMTTLTELKRLTEDLASLHARISVVGDVLQIQQDAQGRFTVNGAAALVGCANEEVTALLGFADGEIRRLYEKLSLEKQL